MVSGGAKPPAEFSEANLTHQVPRQVQAEQTDVVCIRGAE